MRLQILGCVLFFLLVGPLWADSANLQVVFTDGKVELKVDGGWRELVIGETLGQQAMLRLAAGAKLELSGPHGIMAIFRPGVISVAAILEESSQVGSRTIVQMIGARLRKLGGSPGPGQETSAGVRGAEAGATSLQKSLSQAYNESMDQGMQALHEGNFQRAYDHFRDALDLGNSSLQMPAAVFAARAALSLGKANLALDCLSGIEPASDDPLRSLFYLSRAQAALSGLDYMPAQSDFGVVLQSTDADIETRQEALLGLGLCQQAAGDQSAARQSWQTAVTLDSQGDAARLAASLLKP